LNAIIPNGVQPSQAKHHSIEQGPHLDLQALSNEPKNTQISSFEKASKNH
jgi:hypothetical protein